MAPKYYNECTEKLEMEKEELETKLHEMSTEVYKKLKIIPAQVKVTQHT